MLLVYLGLVVLFIIQPNTKQQITGRKAYCVITTFFLFAIAMSRDLKYGDLAGYRKTYNKLPNISYNSLFEDWLSGDRKDFGFYAFSKFFADTGVTPDVWLGIIALIFAASAALYIYKYSSMPYISLVAILSFFYSFTFTGLRQAVALAISFLAYNFISEKKPIGFILTVLIATLFHYSALILLPAYWIAKLKIGWKQPFFVAISLFVAVFTPGLFRSMVKLLSWNNYLLSYSDSEATLSWAGYLIQFAMWIFCLYLRKSIKEDDEELFPYIDALINCLTIGLCLQSFANTIAEMFRLSYYYSICSIVLVPNVIAKQNNTKNRLIICLSVIAVFMLYMLYRKMYFNL